MKLYSDPKYLCRFLSLCQGNWHQTIYVACKTCPNKTCSEPGDFLMLLAQDGSPYFLPLSDACIIFSEQPLPEECLLALSYPQFRQMYRAYLEEFPIPKDTCPFTCLIRSATDAIYDW